MVRSRRRNQSTFTFRCQCCGGLHAGMPSISFAFPIQCLDVPESERALRVELSSELCVIDAEQFFVRGLLEIPVRGTEDPVHLGSLGWIAGAELPPLREAPRSGERSERRPFVGRLCSPPRPYPNSSDLVVSLYLRDKGVRPSVVVARTSHPLGVEQRDGISRRRLAEIYEQMIHVGNSSPREARSVRPAITS